MILSYGNRNRTALLCALLSIGVFGLAADAWNKLQSSLTRRLPTLAAATTRRDFLRHATSAAIMSTTVLQQPQKMQAAGDVATKELASLLLQLQQARQQLDPVPDLINAEQWDKVRGILITAPLSDCWAKRSNNPASLVPQYVQAVGDAGGDELAALDAREELISHLRYLDMAVYNNVFNPIATEGTTGATQQLVRSYYEDPINEYTATVQAFDELLAVGRPP